MSYVITELCTLDGSCVEVCPVACIHTQPDASQYYIDPDVCIECEQCEIVCPVNAIAVDWKLPEQYLPWIEINASFFRKNKAAVAPVSLDTAFQMVRAAQDYAVEINAAVSVAVVDRAGAPIVVAAMDGAKWWTSEIALNKAYTAASFQLATHAMRAESRRPWFRSLVVSTHGRMMVAPGGLPITENALVIGGIGVAGSPTEEDDVRCCQAGLGVGQSHAH